MPGKEERAPEGDPDELDRAVPQETAKPEKETLVADLSMINNEPDCLEKDDAVAQSKQHEWVSFALDVREALEEGDARSSLEKLEVVVTPKVPECQALRQRIEEVLKDEETTVNTLVDLVQHERRKVSTALKLMAGVMGLLALQSILLLLAAL